VPAEPVPESVEEFDHFVKESVMKYVDIAKEVDSQVSEQVRHFEPHKYPLMTPTSAGRNRPP